MGRPTHLKGWIGYLRDGSREEHLPERLEGSVGVPRPRKRQRWQRRVLTTCTPERRTPAGPPGRPDRLHRPAMRESQKRFSSRLSSSPLRALPFRAETHQPEVQQVCRSPGQADQADATTLLVPTVAEGSRGGRFAKGCVGSRGCEGAELQGKRQRKSHDPLRSVPVCRRGVQGCRPGLLEATQEPEWI